MKKKTPVLLSLLLLLVVAGCSTNDKSESKDKKEHKTTESKKEKNKLVDRLSIEDTAIYRGTILEKNEQDDGTTILKVKTAEGYDFAHEEVKVIITKSTQLNVELKDIKVKNFIEVYYNNKDEVQDAKMMEISDAIIVNNFYDEVSVHHVGEVIEVDKHKNKEQEGHILIKNTAGKEVKLNYNGKTAVLLNLDDLKAGDKIMSLTEPTSTRSMPPQYMALEIRLAK